MKLFKEKAAKKPGRYSFFKKSLIPRKGEPYLVRYSIFECPLFSIKIHHILKSDDQCLHDHPWTFVSILLKGSYMEHSVTAKWLETVKNHNENWLLKNGEPLPVTADTFKRYRAGAILYRPAEYTHRLQLDPGATVWSLVFTFKKRRMWGFFTPKQWVPFYEYNDMEELCS